ncbi:MAG: FG-GAP repeat domain-containing protein [Planctomycetota bacterium]
MPSQFLFLSVVLVMIASCRDQISTTLSPADVAEDGRSGILSGSVSHSKSKVHFREVAAEVGLALTIPELPRPMRTLESIGCGCGSIGDDNDGWQDILIVSDLRHRLFRNLRNGKFSDVGSFMRLNFLPHGNWNGFAVGDRNGDGWILC